MKNLFSLFAFATLLAIAGCKNIDQELVGKMQTDVTTLEGLAAPMEELGKKLSNLNEVLNGAPESVKNGGSAEYAEMFNLSGAMYQKQQATMAEFADLQNKLKTLAADYSAGKIKTEDAKKEFETIDASVQGFGDLVKRMNEMADQMQTQYAKMSADWKAKEEGAAK